LAIAFARDFISSAENGLFLDGVIVQEIVHYDDLSFLPDPLRCYQSNIEIRGHHAGDPDFRKKREFVGPD
jgi:hypothetical protein